MLLRDENAPRTCLNPGGLSEVSSNPLTVVDAELGARDRRLARRRRLDHADGGVRQPQRRCDHDR